ncbi:hypothetical protein ACUR5C_07205 [Aliikangiella sp. IMCC44653]
MLNRHHKFYIKNFIENFLKGSHKPNWLKALSSFDELVWNELSAWQFWEDDFISTEEKLDWEDNIYNLTNLSSIQKQLDRICVVIRLGHDNACIQDVMLSEIINSEIYILEGIVIIEPLRLALIINHDGGILVCEKKE